MNTPDRRLEWVVFALVAASFTTIYITQPVLSVLEKDFSADTVSVARTVSAVLLGIVVANLPFGYLSDRYTIRPIIFSGGAAIAGCSLWCAFAADLQTLTIARFVQGCCIPALTTCLAAYLARILPLERLNVVMGSYVAATIFGGMCGRLLGGFIHDPADWRHAFITAGILVGGSCLVASRIIPVAPVEQSRPASSSYIRLLANGRLSLLFLCGAAGQAIFSPVFNTVPYRLQNELIGLSARESSLVYLTYICGVAIGPAAGRLSNRVGNGNAMMIGSGLLAGSLLLLLIPTVGAVVLALVGVCCGFFAVHAAAVGALNRKLESSHGRANALYVLSYYLGATIGVSWSSWVYQYYGWELLIAVACAILIVPFLVGMRERHER